MNETEAGRQLTILFATHRAALVAQRLRIAATDPAAGRWCSCVSRGESLLESSRRRQPRVRRRWQTDVGLQPDAPQAVGENDGNDGGERDDLRLALQTARAGDGVAPLGARQGACPTSRINSGGARRALGPDHCKEKKR